MKDVSRRVGTFWSSALLLVLLLAAERDLKAYADPGTGALLWQAIVAGLIGGLYYLRKLTGYFRRKDRND